MLIIILCGRQSYCSRTVHGTHNHFIQEKNIKNESQGIIHTFKNYFKLLKISHTILFQLIFTFIYDTFSKKISVSAK